MSYIYFCAKSQDEKTELIPVEKRESRWAHLRDLTGILITEEQIPSNEYEFPNSRLSNITADYQGKFLPFD